MRASAWGLLGLLFGCDGAFGPKPHCYPVSCDQLERNCDLVDDHCGHLLDCGGCPDGSFCGLTIKNVCGTPPPVSCTPTKTCASVGAQCGSIDDGCGKQIACPSQCGTNPCGVNNRCQICTPPVCPPPGVGCGTVSNACNQTMDCGSCPMPLKCGLQVPNVCSCPNGMNCSQGPPTLFLAGVAWNRIDLAWADADPSVQQFEIRRSIDGGAFTSVGPVGPAHHSFDAVNWPSGTAVSYQVRAALPNTSNWSNTVSTTAPLRASVWRTLGGDFGHSGYNSVETARAPGTLAWEHTFGGGTLQPVVSEPPWVYVVNSEQSGSSLHLLNLDGGTEAWAKPVPGIAGEPALFDGRVIVATSIAPMPSEYLAFDSSGALVWTGQVPAAGGEFLAPISTGEAIAGSAGPGNALLALESAAGMTLFTSPVPPSGPWTPSLAGGELFVLTGTELDTFDVATGSRTGSMPIQGSMLPGWVAASPDVLAFVAGNQLTIRHFGATVQGGSVIPFVGEVAIDDTNAYATTPSQVVMFDLQTANFHWVWPTDGGIAFPPVTAAGFVYVSTDSTVYAIDTGTGVATWTTTPGGWLSIAGGMLFVASSDRLRAYALTP